MKGCQFAGRADGLEMSQVTCPRPGLLPVGGNDRVDVGRGGNGSQPFRPCGRSALRQHLTGSRNLAERGFEPAQLAKLPEQCVPNALELCRIDF